MTLFDLLNKGARKTIVDLRGGTPLHGQPLSIAMDKVTAATSELSRHCRMHRESYQMAVCQIYDGSYKSPGVVKFALSYHSCSPRAQSREITLSSICGDGGHRSQTTGVFFASYRNAKTLSLILSAFDSVQIARSSKSSQQE
jgi:hypothetical protein